MDFEEGFRIDLLVENRVIIELKSVAKKLSQFMANNLSPISAYQKYRLAS